MPALSLTEAKAHLNITTDQYNTDLTAIIASAEATLAQRCGPLSSTTFTHRIPGGAWHLALPVTPVISLTTVTPYSGTDLTISDLYLDINSGLVTANNLTPFVAAYYDVTYDAGRATCPDDLLLAAKELVRHLWESRRGPSTRSSAEPVQSHLRPLPGTAHALPYRISELIAPHIQVGVG